MTAQGGERNVNTQKKEHRSRRQSPRSVALLVLVVLGLITGAATGIGAARAGDEDFVYDPYLAESVPVELADSLRDSESDELAPGEGGASEGEPVDAPPDAYAGSIATVDGDGDTPPPFFGGMFDAVNAWSLGDANGARIVYAGADGADPEQGVIIDQVMLWSGDDGDEFIAKGPYGSKKLAIKSAAPGLLYLLAANGLTGIYNLSTHTITMCPATAPCGNDQ
jgi:hypothetical protein